MDITLLKGVELIHAIRELSMRKDLTLLQQEVLFMADVCYIQDKQSNAAELLTVVLQSIDGIELSSMSGTMPIALLHMGIGNKVF